MSASVRIMAACAAAVAVLATAVPAQSLTYKGWHIMPTPSYAAKQARIGHKPPQAGEVMNYYGGSVFTAPKVISVMWGSTVNSTIVSTVPGFSTAIVNSTYVDQASANYSTKKKHAINGHHSTRQVIGRGTYFGQVVITPNNTSTNLSDRDVQKELK